MLSVDDQFIMLASHLYRAKSKLGDQETWDSPGAKVTIIKNSFFSYVLQTDHSDNKFITDAGVVFYTTLNDSYVWRKLSALERLANV